ncbi:MAG: hypothetical protein WC701_01445 [Kiritimatiellales bacterium]
MEKFLMLCGMNWGCLSFLILFPVGIVIWAAGERRRRAAMPTDALNKLEAEEDYGPIDEKLECIFCHSKNCVRSQAAHFIQPPAHVTEKNIEARIRQAHCISCGSHWEMFPPEEDKG